MFSRIIILSVGATFLASATAALAGEPVLGRQVAQKLCVNCHIIEPDGKAKVVNPAVPTFMAVAAMADQSESTIRAYLIDPHPPMPDPKLTTNELDNIAAYIMSLKE